MTVSSKTVSKTKAANRVPNEGKVYLGGLHQGKIVAPEDAVISIFDRGFLYGDSIYETLRVDGGVPFRFAAHVARLQRSGALVGFELPWSEVALAKIVANVLAESKLDGAYLRMIATRGSGPLGLDPGLAQEPQLVVIAAPLPVFPATFYTQGRRAVTVSIRRNFKRAIDPRAKTGNYMNNVLAQQEALARGADEAIMLNRQGEVAEASAANLFAWIDGGWKTPPLEAGILEGITRTTLMELCARQGISCCETVLWPADLARAEEIFVCASVRQLVPVVALDETPVGEGKVGKHTMHLRQIYLDEVIAEGVRMQRTPHWGCISSA